MFRGRAGNAVESSISVPGPVASRHVLRDLPFVVPVDFSQPSLRRLADKSIAHATPACWATLTAVPLQSGVCDLAVSCQVLQHLDAAPPRGGAA